MVPEAVPDGRGSDDYACPLCGSAGRELRWHARWRSFCCASCVAWGPGKGSGAPLLPGEPPAVPVDADLRDGTDDPEAGDGPPEDILQAVGFLLWADAVDRRNREG